MGKKRNSSYEESSPENCENVSNSEDEISPPRKKSKSKHKKSKKHKLSNSDASCEYSESENVERKRHKHKHKRHKHHINKYKSDSNSEPEANQYQEKYKHERSHSAHKAEEFDGKHYRSSRESNQLGHHRQHSEEKYDRHSSHRRKNVGLESELHYRSMDARIENQSSKWDEKEESNSNLRIKVEQLSGDESDQQFNSDRGKNETGARGDQGNREEWSKENENKMEKKETNAPKEKTNFGLSGKLTEDANTYNGVVIKYSQPPEARKPKRRWRWYIFKGDQELPFLPLHRQSAYLIGRERKVADIPTDHPSCSKQHAVFQYRLVTYEREDGTKGRTVKPYILDLESANGTYVNNRRIQTKCYVELLEKDVVKFGYSSREYVLLHEASKGSSDDIPDAEAEMSPISLLRSK